MKFHAVEIYDECHLDEDRRGWHRRLVAGVPHVMTSWLPLGQIGSEAQTGSGLL